MTVAALVVIFATGLILLSWRQHRHERNMIAILLLVLSGLLLRSLFVAVPHLHPWDERYHALVAKHMMDDPFRPVLYPDPALPIDQHDWSKSHIWVHKPPLPLWSMAASMALFGVNVIALRLPSLLLSVLSIMLCYGIARRLFDRSAAWSTAAFISIHGLLLQLTGGATATDHIDVFLFFFIMLAIWAGVRWKERPAWHWSLLAGTAIGCAVLSKWIVGLFPLLIIFLLGSRIPDRKKMLFHFATVIVVMLCITLPWEIHINSQFPAEAAIVRDHTFGHVDRVLEDHTGKKWWYHLQKLGMLHGEAIYLPLLWPVWRICRGDRDHRNFLLVLWIAVPLLIFSIARTKMQAYTIMATPAIYMCAALFIGDLFRSNARPILKVIGIALVILMPYRIMLNTVKPWRSQLEKPAWMTDIDRLSKDPSEKTIIFNSERPIETMFHRDVIAYEGIPPEELIHRAEALGYRVVVLP